MKFISQSCTRELSVFINLSEEGIELCKCYIYFVPSKVFLVIIKLKFLSTVQDFEEKKSIFINICTKKLSQFAFIREISCMVSFFVIQLTQSGQPCEGEG